MVVALANACGNDRGTSVIDDDADVYIEDVRVQIPEPDPRFLDLITPEQVLQPGQETMFCLHLEHDQADLAIRYMGGIQGAGGHHLALFTTTDPKPPGTVEDCTSSEQNAKLQWFVLTFEGLPEHHAIRIPHGMHYVLQFHYINYQDTPIRVRDVARLEKVDPASVTTWVSTLISTKIDLQIPPGPSKKSWDCVLDQDRDLLIACGHMHDLGKRFTIEVGPDADHLTNIYTVDPWQGQFRDNPPVNKYYEAPLRLPAGTIIRTTCEWMNTGVTTAGFPEEMCTSFAYATGEQLLQCEPSPM